MIDWICSKKILFRAFVEDIKFNQMEISRHCFPWRIFTDREKKQMCIHNEILQFQL